MSGIICYRSTTCIHGFHNEKADVLSMYTTGSLGWKGLSKARRTYYGGRKKGRGELGEEKVDTLVEARRR